MVNEKYKLMMLGDIIAQKYQVCPLLIIVADSDQGKTDTKKMFMRDCDTAYEVESISKAALVSSLGNRKISTYVLDDTESWNDDDLVEILSTFKTIVTEHLIKPQRETKFSREAAKLAYAQCVVLLNNEQYQPLYPKIKKSGVFTRAIIAFLLQTEETIQYCSDFYDDNNYSSVNLPHFTEPSILIEERTNEDLKETYEWIKNHFRGFRAKVIKRYAKLLSADDFKRLKPILMSTHRHPAIEEIKFEEEIL